ncbi:LPXTG cell wall anchor domain-containing protein [Streptomyces sp. NPDC127092]|uniref:LPXTG cell wall anchor domain-containing protein n=1 Tax=Streptomyces sp. NPDC127092 TaxID=3347135 RepID=UPI003652FD58
MKIRRILATAVAAAVTTPVVFLSAAPAFAEDKPAAQTQDQKQTIKELREAVVKAQGAYDASVVAYAKAQEALAALDKADNPLKKAAADAKKASDDAAAAKAAADKKLADAEKALAEIQAKPDATPDEKALAEKAVADAKTAADAAKATAETKAAEATEAQDALDDARVAAVREAEKARVAKEKAAKELDAAKDALREAEEEDAETGEGCDKVEFSEDLVTTLSGPAKITAGQSGVYTLHVSNKGEDTLVDVIGYADAMDEEGNLFDLAWSAVGSSTWQPLDEEDDFFPGPASLGPGKSFDVKLKVTVDAKTPAKEGAVYAGADYETEDGTCGFADESAYAGFTITKPTQPGTGGTAGNGNTTQQGGQSTTPVTTGTSGTLANTGAGSSTMPIALAAGAAVVLGAGAMVVVRRRKAGADA